MTFSLDRGLPEHAAVAQDRYSLAGLSLDRSRIDRSHPTRSAITVAGIAGKAFNSSRIRGSNPSTTDPAGLRSYFGGRSLAIAARTVFLEIPIARAIALTGISSARCSLRISAQSSTESTPFTPWLG